MEQAGNKLIKKMPFYCFKVETASGGSIGCVSEGVAFSMALAVPSADSVSCQRSAVSCQRSAVRLSAVSCQAVSGQLSAISCQLSGCHCGDPGFIVLVGFAMDKVALGEACPRVCDFAPISIILPLLYELGARLAAGGSNRLSVFTHELKWN